MVEETMKPRAKVQQQKLMSVKFRRAQAPPFSMMWDRALP